MSSLVTGEPDSVDPPMRRLTVFTISGIMVAIVIAVAFAVIGLIRPGGGDDWMADGSVIVERETGARFVMIGGKLHPAINYASAVLASGATGPVSVELVSHEDLEGVERGPAIGTEGLPDSLPEAEELARGPVSVCSKALSDGGVDSRTEVVVDIGGVEAMTKVDPQEAAYVESFDRDRFVLYGGRRHLVDGGQVAAKLGITEQPVTVGSAFLTAVPLGQPLTAPAITGAGAERTVSGYRVGQLIDADGRLWVVLHDGVALTTDVQAALLGTMKLGGEVRPPVELTSDEVFSLPESSQGDAELDGLTDQLPDAMPAISSEVERAGGACAIFSDGETEPTLAAPDGVAPSSEPAEEGAGSELGVADEVRLRPGIALVVKSPSAAAVNLIAEPGKSFPAANLGVLAGFGYGEIEPVVLPAELIKVIPVGPALDREPIFGQTASS